MKSILLGLSVVIMSSVSLATTATCGVTDIANDYFNRSDCEFSRHVRGNMLISGERAASIEFNCGDEVKRIAIRIGGYTCTANDVLLDWSEVAEEAAGAVGHLSHGVN